MRHPSGEGDRRAKATRAAILRAFTDLVFDRRYDAIRIADLTASAKISHATFYAHFKSKEEVLLTALEPLLVSIASAATGRAGAGQLRPVLEHLWIQRRVAATILTSSAASRIQGRLSAMIRKRMTERATDGPATLSANAAAAAQLTMLTIWLRGAASCPRDLLAQRLIACGDLVAGRIRMESTAPDSLRT